MKNFYRRGMLVIIFLVFLAFLFILFSTQAKASNLHTTNSIYQQQIRGTVRNEDGDGLMGVSVIIKNRQYGTVTDKDGIYDLQVYPEDTLVFTSVGYKRIEMPVKGRNVLDVVLREDIASLGEVQINAGYYNTTRRERTGNISQVSASEIENQPVISPIQALQGRMAGVEVQQPSGVPGLASAIRIRGKNSLRPDGNYPLFIVNGVPVNSVPINSIGAFSSNSGIDPLNTLNLSNIESIEVLKDADATAIYGSRGANGVILITTKSGDTNKETSLNVRYMSGISKVSNKMELMNTDQYLSLRRQAFANDGVEPNEINAPDLVLWNQDRYTDWQEELLGETAVFNDLNVSITGGNENTSFLLGGSYQNRGDVFPGDFGYHKITTNLNLHHNSEDQKLKVDLSVNYGIDENRLFFGTNFVQMALTLAPNAPAIYNEDGGLNWAEGSWSNPLAGLYRPQDINTNSLLSNLNLSYELFPGFAIKSSIGYSYLENTEVVRNLLNAYNPDVWNRVVLNSNHSSNKRKSFIIEPQISYNRSYNKFGLQTLIGATFQQNQDAYLFVEGSGYSNDRVVGNLAAADQVRINNNQDVDYRYAAIFGRIGVYWADKYFLNLTGRRDGSSRFGPNKRFSEFYAVGSAWVFSEEALLKEHLPFLSFGKLRGSYGTSGSDQIPDYGYLDTYAPTPGAGGFYPTKLFNPDYSWEVNKKLEVAIQLGFVKDRINLDLSWYRNRSSNQLVGYPLPSTTGFNSVQANLPATIENTGLEIGLATTNIQHPNFSWKTSLNFTAPRNKLIKFDDLEESSYRNTYRIGQPLDIALLYRFDSINPETGQYQVLDFNQDGRLDNSDRVIEANLGRKYYSGLQNDFRIKNFSVGFLLEYVKQNRRSYLADVGIAPGRLGNNSTEFLNFWMQDGDSPEIQKPSQGITSLLAYFDAINSDLIITDASFLRMKTLSLGFQFNPGFLDNFGIEACSLSLNAQNLFTLTNYIGLDPQGGKGVPPLRTITSGIQLNF